MYGRKLTKEDIIETGITKITADGHVFKGEREVFPNANHKQGYLMHFVYDRDENGDKIKVTRGNSYDYKQRSVGLHRLMWAWHYGEVPEGMVVDHIDNKHYNFEDYRLENLQLQSPRDNVLKEHPEWNQKEIKCKLNKPRKFYGDKLEKYLEAHEEAKKAHDAELCHKLRSNISQTRARLRYYDNHIDEYLANPEAFKKPTNATKKKAMRKEIAIAREAYREAKNNVNSTLAEIATLQTAWHDLVSEYNAFCEDCKK